MSYTVEIIRCHEQNTSAWSGGTTTQIAIYPPQAVYGERNFKWRLSSATVDQEESLFTPLPGIERVIMVLAGEMKLEHAGHHTVHLKPFEQDRFLGDWTSRSFGKVRDFNLMLSAGYSGQLKSLAVPALDSRAIEINPAATTTAFYCIDSSITFTIGMQDCFELLAGDLLLLTAKTGCKKNAITLANSVNKPAQLVIADITYAI
ncbi:HutD family protein [Sporomusa aerivorans]|uniref:HutD/Ves family protein n=1 Tax=Sporomusa aerivorans TaxID=204936 RepID=UPI00352AEACC